MDKISFKIDYDEANFICIKYFFINLFAPLLLWIFMPSPVIVLILIIIFSELKFVIFDRGLRVITEIMVDDNKIELLYYKFFVTKKIEIKRNTFGKILVEKSTSKLVLNICDNRFISPPCMSVEYNEAQKKHVWKSKAEIQSAIKLFELHNYKVEYS